MPKHSCIHLEYVRRSHYLVCSLSIQSTGFFISVCLNKVCALLVWLLHSVVIRQAAKTHKATNIRALGEAGSVCCRTLPALLASMPSYSEPLVCLRCWKITRLDFLAGSSFSRGLLSIAQFSLREGEAFVSMRGLLNFTSEEGLLLSLFS